MALSIEDAAEAVNQEAVLAPNVLSFSEALVQVLGEVLEQVHVASNFPTDADIEKHEGNVALALTNKLAFIRARSTPPSPLELVLMVLAKQYPGAEIRSVDLSADEGEAETTKGQPGTDEEKTGL